MDEEIKLEESETHKEFWLGVNYYGGSIPYLICYDSRESASGDAIYKIRVPYRKVTDGE